MKMARIVDLQPPVNIILCRIPNVVFTGHSKKFIDSMTSAALDAVIR